MPATPASNRALSALASASVRLTPIFIVAEPSRHSQEQQCSLSLSPHKGGEGARQDRRGGRFEPGAQAAGTRAWNSRLGSRTHHHRAGAHEDALAHRYRPELRHVQRRDVRRTLHRRRASAEHAEVTTRPNRRLLRRAGPQHRVLTRARRAGQLHRDDARGVGDDQVLGVRLGNCGDTGGRPPAPDPAGPACS